MSGFKVEFSVLNLQATPGIYASSLATRPAASYPGRVFIDTDNPSTGMYRDTGTVWVQIAGTGGGSQDLQQVTNVGNTTTNSASFGHANAPVSPIDARQATSGLNNASNWGLTVNNTPTIASGASFGVNYVNAIYGFQSETFLGNATIGNTGLNTAGLLINQLNNDVAATVTVNQASTIRTISGTQTGLFFDSGSAITFTHLSALKTLQPIKLGAGIATVTNYYNLLLADNTGSLSGGAAALNFTNRWGIYQEGANDPNYFNGNIMVKSTTNNGNALQITGAGNLTGNLTANSFIKINGLSTEYLMADGSVTTGGGGITGSGTTNYVPKFTGSTALGNSVIYEDSTNVLIGTTTNAGYKLDVVGGDARINTVRVGLGAGAELSNIAVGASTLNSNTTGFRNVGIGADALKNITTGWANVAIGWHAGQSMTTNIGSILIGSEAGANLIAGGSAIAIGRNACGATTTSGNIGIGDEAVLQASTGGGNIGIGGAAGRGGNGSSNISIGNGTMSFSGGTPSNNINIGPEAGIQLNTNANNNTLIGYRTGYYLINGSSNIVIGHSAGFNLSSGNQNILIGNDPGITTGNYNTIIGYGVTGLSSSLSNTIILADGQGNQRLYINSSGNAGIGQTSPTARLSVVPANNTIGFDVTGSSLTSANAQSLIDLAQTWNTTGSPTLIKANVTNTASGSSSLLMDLQVGGTSKFAVTKSGAVGINTSAPNAAALLQIDSTTQGLLLPRMTTTEINNITTPPNGLLVYNTTIDHFCGYQAGAWVKFSHSPM